MRSLFPLILLAACDDGATQTDPNEDAGPPEAGPPGLDHAQFSPTCTYTGEPALVFTLGPLAACEASELPGRLVVFLDANPALAFPLVAPLELANGGSRAPMRAVYWSEQGEARAVESGTLRLESFSIQGQAAGSYALRTVDGLDLMGDFVANACPARSAFFDPPPDCYPYGSPPPDPTVGPCAGTFRMQSFVLDAPMGDPMALNQRIAQGIQTQSVHLDLHFYVDPDQLHFVDALEAVERQPDPRVPRSEGRPLLWEGRQFTWTEPGSLHLRLEPEGETPRIWSIEEATLAGTLAGNCSALEGRLDGWASIDDGPPQPVQARFLALRLLPRF